MSRTDPSRLRLPSVHRARGRAVRSSCGSRRRLPIFTDQSTERAGASRHNTSPSIISSSAFSVNLTKYGIIKEWQNQNFKTDLLEDEHAKMMVIEVPF
eukprot:COSAG02_NODE_709_length_18217_cov_13.019704_13_plen_98_part_00